MKKIFIPLLLVFSVIFTSCEPTESPIYDGSQTLAYFGSTSGTVEVLINETGQITVPVNVSTLSSEARTVMVSVNEDDTSATAGQYSFSNSVTIPANSYFGELILTGIDDGLTTSGVSLSLQIDSVDGGVGSSENFTATLVEICPVESTFAVGNYLLNFVSGGVPAAGFSPAMGDGVTVTLEVGESSTERVFNVKFYPAFGFANPPVDFSFNLVCEETTVNGIVEPGVSGVGCGSSIPMGESSNPGAYSAADDTTITFKFIEDVDGASCGTEAETIYTLTKI